MKKKTTVVIPIQKKAPALDGQYIYKGESVSIHFLIRSTQMYHPDSLQLS